MYAIVPIDSRRVRTPHPNAVSRGAVCTPMHPVGEGKSQNGRSLLVCLHHLSQLAHPRSPVYLSLPVRKARKTRTRPARRGGNQQLTHTLVSEFPPNPSALMRFRTLVAGVGEGAKLPLPLPYFFPLSLSLPPSLPVPSPCVGPPFMAARFIRSSAFVVAVALASAVAVCNYAFVFARSTSHLGPQPSTRFHFCTNMSAQFLDQGEPHHA
jgi:hypothetical protein